jgi:hypothetical protein
MKPFTIIGAGMAGLLAGAMLREEALMIMESQDSLPNNHSAVLRFRSSIVGDALGIPFKRVKVMKSIMPARNPLADMLQYSLKVTGTLALRSIISVNGEINERYIAPSDLIERMVRKVVAPIKFGAKFDIGDIMFDPNELYISTIPMPSLMKILGWKQQVEFKFRSGVNIKAKLRVPSDVYCSLYVPHDQMEMSRISITGDEMIVECYPGTEAAKDPVHWAQIAAGLMGLPFGSAEVIDCKEQKYAKILPIDEEVRREFIMWASREHNVYSLGRFATWRPGLLLDDVVNDVRVIQRIAGRQASIYDHKKKDI